MSLVLFQIVAISAINLAIKEQTADCEKKKETGTHLKANLGVEKKEENQIINNCYFQAALERYH